jgi:acetoin utilization deacetylase AcuC-like enzyme
MRLSASAFREMTRHLLELARKHCEGKAVFVLEGGYDLDALRECVETTLFACLS